jgi:predicted nucleic acid-binding protein
VGQVVLPPSGQVYVDTNAVIYAVEQIEPYLSAAAPLWNALDAGQQQIVTSELTLLEVLVKPLRDANQALTDLYRRILLGTVGLTCLPISLAFLERAAALRASHNLRTPDAIHAATALEAGCALFVTNDPGFRSVAGLNIAVLDEIVAST